jgi:tripartite-type tricarboxylate transporter receptor subunit TctC
MIARLLAVACVAAALAAPPPALAQGAYPARAVKFIVPITPGGSNDVVARVIATKLSEAWGQPVVVENRPGAGMNVGADLVAKSAPDGYTWLLGANSIFVHNPHVGKTPFDPLKDFTPVTTVATVPFVLVVHPSLPVNNVAELVEYAKKNPGKLNYGSSGNGSPQQLAAEMLSYYAGIKMQHVPYKGAVPAITDLLEGRIQVFIGAVNSLLPLIREGSLRALAATSLARIASLPDVPTLSEAAFPGFEVGSGVGLVAPAATPSDIVETLNREIGAIIATPGFHQRMALIGVDVVGTTPAAYAKFISDDYAKWGKVVAASGIKPE